MLLILVNTFALLILTFLPSRYPSYEEVFMFPAFEKNLWLIWSFLLLPLWENSLKCVAFGLGLTQSAERVGFFI